MPIVRTLLPLLAFLASIPAVQAAPPEGEVEVELIVAPREARPGDPVMVRLRHATSKPHGHLGETPLSFVPYREGWIAFTSLPMETQPGPVAVRIRPGWQHPPLFASLEVQPGNWRTRSLTVSSAHTSQRSEELEARIQADREAFARALSGERVTPHFSAPFILPRDAALTAFFGDQRVFNGSLASVHYGLDLRGGVGAPIHAANAGVVVMVRDCFTSGNTVIVYHGAGLYTLYFHLSRFDVSEGQRVERGQLLGAVGSTGRVTGPHLHWSVHVDGRYVDPQRLLELALD